MPTPRLTPEIISAAIDGFEAQKIRIDTQIAELRAMLPGATKTTTDSPASEVPTGKRSKFSAAVRQRMADGQRLRWAKIKGAGQAPAAVAAKASTLKGKKVSAITLMRMREAQRLRWAKIRGEGEPAIAPAAAKTEKPKAKRQISPEGIARIIAATKKRWALKRTAEKASAKIAAPTKTAVSKKATKKTARAAEQAAG
jgi:hypothetical protein